MFDNDFVEQVRSRLDIVSLISEYVPLTKKGHNYFGCCPFHHEKTPSFSVNADKNFFHCFGCGKGGDAFAFYMDIESVGFNDAVKSLATRVGLEIPGQKFDPREDAERKRQSSAYTILERAARFYHKNLAAADGERARDYLKQRRIQPKIIEQFSLGYSGDRLALFNELQLLPEELALAVEIGLLQRDDDGQYYNPQALRLMIPIRDNWGHTIGFGARTLSSNPNMAKYLNSPQSFIFDKGRHLFAYNLAKSEVLKRQEILLVEGYMDVIACFQLGYPLAVASLGTAITEHHLENILKLKCRVILGLDSDSSGTNAALKASELMLSRNINVTVAHWPAKDPGELIGTPDLFIQAIHNSKQACAHFIDLAVAGLDGSVEKVVAAVDLLAPLLAALPAGLQHDLYLAMAAEKLHLEEGQLRQAIHKSRASKRLVNLNRAPLRPPAGQNQPPVQPPKPPPPPPFNRLELQAVKEIVARQSLWCYISELVPQFADARLGRFLTEIANSGKLPPIEEAAELLENIELARELSATNEIIRNETPDSQVLNDLRLSLQEQSLKADLFELQKAIENAQKAGDSELIGELLVQKKKLRTDYQSIKETRRNK